MTVSSLVVVSRRKARNSAARSAAPPPAAAAAAPAEAAALKKQTRRGVKVNRTQPINTTRKLGKPIQPANTPEVNRRYIDRIEQLRNTMSKNPEHLETLKHKDLQGIVKNLKLGSTLPSRSKDGHIEGIKTFLDKEK